MDILNATLEDLKKYRPDLCDMLLDEFLKASSQEAPKKPASPIIEEVKAVEGVKKGDAIRWNYTKEEGIVVGFENEDGISNIIVQRYNGSKIFFENDPRLFKILEDEEKAKVLSKREKYISETKEKKKAASVPIPPRTKTKRDKTIYDGVMYEEPTRKGSKLKIGYTIRYKLTKEIGKIIGFVRKGGLDRIVLRESPGIPSTIIDNPNAYEIIDDINEDFSSKGYKKLRRRAKVGDHIMLGIDNSIWKVIDSKGIGEIDKLTLIQKNKKTKEIVNSPSLYTVIVEE